jgi:hypothetical protein
MLNEQKQINVEENFAKKKEYFQPQLVIHGQVRDLTKAAGGSGTEANCGPARNSPGTRSCSDRIAKENIVRIGTHPLGIGLYFFDYKPEYQDSWGCGRQFGVMADEVETVMPEAVSDHPNGHKVVDYGMLGISRNIH